MGLKVTYRDRETIVPEGVAVIGSDPDATVRVARPGISRRHLVVEYTDGRWVAHDPGSRNGTYLAGHRTTTVAVDGTVTLHLGHPTDGEVVVLEPVTSSPVGPRPSGARGVAHPATAPDPRLDELVAALRDTVSAVRGLTWSVWAMIAVTAVLALLTLFVAILG